VGLGGGALERALAAGSPSLSTARRRTYRALVEAVGTAPGNQVEPAGAVKATAAFVSDYEERPPDVRRRIDAVLDAIEAAQRGRRFSRMSRQQRLELLRSLLRGSSGDDARRNGAMAVQLAALPFQPDPDEFGISPVAIG
jgi:hypothetical protein